MENRAARARDASRACFQGPCVSSAARSVQIVCDSVAFGAAAGRQTSVVGGKMLVRPLSQAFLESTEALADVIELGHSWLLRFINGAPA
jgi:hypothetical protein